MDRWTALWVTALVGSSAAFAQPPVDSDGDGRISLQEFQARGAERFARLDADGDGYLTREEIQGAREGFRSAGRERGRQFFAAADTDGDGALSLAEMQAVRPGMTAEQFARIDANNDGLVTPDERPMRRRPDF
jgi:Ca2+-binding EF-hand superfamily protein